MDSIVQTEPAEEHVSGDAVYRSDQASGSRSRRRGGVCATRLVRGRAAHRVRGESRIGARLSSGEAVVGAPEISFPRDVVQRLARRRDELDACASRIVSRNQNHLFVEGQNEEDVEDVFAQIGHSSEALRTLASLRCGVRDAHGVWRDIDPSRVHRI